MIDQDHWETMTLKEQKVWGKYQGRIKGGGGSTGVVRAHPFSECAPIFQLATLFLTFNWNNNHFLFVVVFFSYSNNTCDLLKNAPLLIDMPSQCFYNICPYNMADQVCRMPKQSKYSIYLFWIEYYYLVVVVIQFLLHS